VQERATIFFFIAEVETSIVNHWNVLTCSTIFRFLDFFFVIFVYVNFVCHLFLMKCVVFLIVCFLFPKSLKLKYRSEKCIVAQHDLTAEHPVLIFVPYSLPKPLQHAHTHTHTQSSENAIMWHHSADSENLLCIPVGIRGVWSSPLFICRAEGWLLLWKCQVHLVRLPQHSSTRCMVSQPISPVCLFEGGTVDNRGHWEVHTVDGYLTIAGMLGHACELWALEELFSKWL